MFWRSMGGRQLPRMDKKHKKQCSQSNRHYWLHVLHFASIALLSSHQFISNQWAWLPLAVALCCCGTKSLEIKLRRRPQVYVWDCLELPIPFYDCFYSRLLHLYKNSFEVIGPALTKSIVKPRRISLLVFCTLPIKKNLPGLLESTRN